MSAEKVVNSKKKKKKKKTLSVRIKQKIEFVLKSQTLKVILILD